MTNELEPILSQFPATKSCAATRDLVRIDGGFSGASVWRFECASQRWAVRCWPTGYRADRLAWIQSILLSLPATLAVPKPLLSSSGQSFVSHDGLFWTVETWLLGVADFWTNPTNQRLQAAMRMLAEFHRATNRWSQGPHAIPAIQERIDALHKHSKSLASYEEAMIGQPHDFESLLRKLLAAARDELPQSQAALEQVASSTSVLIPCIRDVWHDHVLFTADQVTGLIDFGAMRMDSVAVDIARLAGSLAGDDRRMRALAVSAYAAVNPLTQTDLSLVNVIDASSPVIAGLNWVRWLCVEKRTFPDTTKVLERMQKILERLKGVEG